MFVHLCYSSVCYCMLVRGSLSLQQPTLRKFERDRWWLSCMVCVSLETCSYIVVSSELIDCRLLKGSLDHPLISLSLSLLLSLGRSGNVASGFRRSDRSTVRVLSGAPTWRLDGYWDLTTHRVCSLLCRIESYTIRYVIFRALSRFEPLFRFRILYWCLSKGGRLLGAVQPRNSTNYMINTITNHDNTNTSTNMNTTITSTNMNTTNKVDDYWGQYNRVIILILWFILLLIMMKIQFILLTLTLILLMRWTTTGGSTTACWTWRTTSSGTLGSRAEDPHPQLSLLLVITITIDIV